MLNTALALTVATGLAAQIYPDELDILRGADTRPQMELVLDTSGSMADTTDLTPTSCAHYFPGGAPTYDLTKTQLLKAVLTGCQTASDGILDQWANRVFFAIREFGGDPGPGCPAWGCVPRVQIPPNGDFDPNLNNRANLEAAVLGLPAFGLTPLSEAYRQAANHLAAFWTDANSATCRQNYIVMMTDGDGTNGNFGSILNQGAGNSSIEFWDIGAGPSGVGDAADAAQHIARSDTNFFQFIDAMPNITGVQPIRTYTIGFGTGISAVGQNLLQRMATQGDGGYWSAVGYQQLSDAFTQIILSVVARSNVAFNPGTIQNDGLVSGNYVYSTSFKPYDKGAWFGTTKKHCMAPTSPTDTTCLLMDDGSGNLIVNPTPRDIWTNTNSSNAAVGGTGEVIWRDIFGVTGPTDPVPATPFARNILTWAPGSNSYTPVDNTSSWRKQDSFARNNCEHNALISRLHGYTAQANNCGTNFLPTALEEWPLGDTVHGDTILLKYTQNCETGGSDRCYVATVANDGMLHFFRATDGREVSAVIPGHLWSDNNVAIHQLRDLMNQPNLSEMRLYYFDGGMRLFHDDTNGNGYIDGTESAKLIAGLGRGGRSYIMWDVNTFNGTPNATDNPPQELMVDQSSSFKHLRETWNAPWLGRHRHADNNVYNVAIFPSGHDRELDKPSANFGGVFQPGLPPPTGDSHTSPNVQGCPAFFANTGAAGAVGALLCNPPIPSTGCTPCSTGASCGLVNCYDWPGYVNNPLVPPVFRNGAGGHDIMFGPFTWTDGSRVATSYRLIFNRFDLQPNDYMAFLDGNQNEIGRITGSHPTGATSPWIDDGTFYVRLVTNGVDDVSSTGFSLQRAEVVRAPLPVLATGQWRPTIYMVDLNNFNGTSGAPATEFPTQPAAGDTRQQTGVLVRITSDCEGLEGTGEVCIDATGSAGQPAMPDLAYMTCPISMEPAVLEEGGLAEGIYWGDECGQIFRAVRDTSGVWNAKRLLHANNLAAGGLTMTGPSKDFRKIFANLEIVRSTCNGGSAIGAYFGTGNLQRPALLDNLQTDAITTFMGQYNSVNRNVIGVVWDHPTLPVDAGLANLENVTFALQVADPTASAKNGWLIELYTNAALLREPLVFDGVAYFRTYEPTTPATECFSAVGIEQLYVMDNCTARPTTDGNNNGTIADSFADRFSETTSADIGAAPSLFTPATGTPTVIGGGTKTHQPRRAVKYMMWRTTID